jgi:4-amino-4-deoxy-L-arabinose transferase-like glycosyltransferase
MILVILLAASFLRFFKLDRLPEGLHPDEAANGLDITSMFDSHKFAAIYDTNGPREALFLYLQAIPVFVGKVTGWAFLNFTPLSLRIAPAILGVVTVYGIYLLGKELFNKNVGIFASLALTVSAWHIQFSRNGFRAIMAPLALVFLFYFLIRAYKKGQVKDYIGTGVTLALGFYTYLSFRMVPLVLMALFVYIIVTDKTFIKKNIKNIGILAAVFFVIMIPMIVHFIHVPGDIAGRSSTSIFNPETNGGSVLGALTDNIVKTLKMFNFAGDENFRHNLGGTPMLDIFVGVLMWFGVILSLIRIKKIEYFLLIMWFGALTLPEILTSEGIPHALRIVGVMPVVFLWAAIGLDWILTKIKAKYALYTGMLLLIIISGGAGFYKYFILFPSYSDSREAYAENMVEIANDIKKQTHDTEIILLAGEYGTKTVQFITYPDNPSIHQYEVYDIKNMKLPKGHYKMYIEREWKDDVVRELNAIGFDKGLTAVPSKTDKRIIYYEYSE